MRQFGPSLIDFLEFDGQAAVRRQRTDFAVIGKELHVPAKIADMADHQLPNGKDRADPASEQHQEREDIGRYEIPRKAFGGPYAHREDFTRNDWHNGKGPAVAGTVVARQGILNAGRHLRRITIDRQFVHHGFAVGLR